MGAAQETIAATMGGVIALQTGIGGEDGFSLASPSSSSCSSSHSCSATLVVGEEQVKRPCTGPAGWPPVPHPHMAPLLPSTHPRTRPTTTSILLQAATSTTRTTDTTVTNRSDLITPAHMVASMASKREFSFNNHSSHTTAVVMPIMPLLPDPRPMLPTSLSKQSTWMDELRDVEHVRLEFLLVEEDLF